MKHELLSAAGPHLDPSLLDRFAARDLSAAEVRAIDEHLARCGTCADLARERTRSSLRAWRRRFTADAPAPLEHPHRNRELVQYARGRLDRVQRELIASHLDECETCAAVVEHAPARTMPWSWVAVAASVAAAVLIVVPALWLRPANSSVSPVSTPATVAVDPRPVPPLQPEPQRQPAVQPLPAPQVAARYADPEWDSLVREARQRGRLEVSPDLRDFRGAPDFVRGTPRPVTPVSPAGRVVGEARPAFSWPARASATYTVFVFDGDREVARSGTLRETRWTPERDLPRGRLLTWQVEAAVGDTIETIPRPPAPPAVFRIAREGEWGNLTRARTVYPDDALLLGILYARAGMLGEAEASLRRAARTDSAAQKLLADLARVK